MKSSSNLVCIRHPHYNGDTNPDLSCKTCCSKFVDKIRAQQAQKFESTWVTSSKSLKDDFTPMATKDSPKAVSKRQTNFDASWV